jgi:excisionase family DNA binding protein
METIEQSVRRMNPISALPKERSEVAALSKLLDAAAHVVPSSPPCELRGPKGETIRLPESVFYLLKQVVDIMAQGDAITIVPVGREVTTQQAANLLNMSRQYLVRLLDDGMIPFRRTGKHRRLKIEDVLSYKSNRDRERKAALDKLAAMSQEFGGYEELRNDPASESKPNK